MDQAFLNLRAGDVRRAEGGRPGGGPELGEGDGPK
jgi:hypothetical protein